MWFGFVVGFGGSLDVAGVLDFVDSGKDLILAADSTASDLIRNIAAECGVDFDEVPLPSFCILFTPSLPKIINIYQNGNVDYNFGTEVVLNIHLIFIHTVVVSNLIANGIRVIEHNQSIFFKIYIKQKKKLRFLSPFCRIHLLWLSIMAALLSQKLREITH